MKLDEIMDQWNADCKLLETDLREAQLKVPYQLGTWQQIYAIESRILKKAEIKKEEMYKLLHDWLYAYPTVADECKALGINESPKKPVTKEAAERTIKTHYMYTKVDEAHAAQKVKVEIVASLLDNLKWRNKQIENLIRLDERSGGVLTG